MKNKSIYEVITSLLILLFAYTALSKLIAYKQFKSVLKQAPLLGAHAELIAGLVPAGELVLVVLLLIPKTQLAGLRASFLTLAGFTVYLIYMLLASNNLPCQCGGVISTLTWKGHVAFNLGGMALTGYAMRIHQWKKTTVSNILNRA